MSIKDTRSGMSRLDEAKDIANEIMRKLRGEYGSLYAFTSDTMQLSPSTLDYLFLRLMLRQMQINEGETSGTDIGQAISKIRQEYFQEPSLRLKTLIVFSDGGDTRLDDLTGSSRDQAIDSITRLLDDAENKQLRVFTIGLGGRDKREIPGLTYQGKPVWSGLEEDILRKLSVKGRGRFYFANDYSPMQIAEDIVTRMSQDTSYVEAEPVELQQEYLAPIYDKYFQWPLGIALASLLLAILIPETLKTRES
jgi:Ca-activated chloride channel family protein